jgi:ABC-type transport system involved in cytochrome c biogenesis permease subunit
LTLIFSSVRLLISFLVFFNVFQLSSTSFIFSQLPRLFNYLCFSILFLFIFPRTKFRSCSSSLTHSIQICA